MSTVDALKDLGYNTLQAENASRHWRCWREKPVDLLFTDLVLSGAVNGRALAEAARDLQPAIRILYTSGYKEAPVPDGHADTDLLSKPLLHGRPGFEAPGHHGANRKDRTPRQEGRAAVAAVTSCRGPKQPAVNYLALRAVLRRAILTAGRTRVRPGFLAAAVTDLTRRLAAAFTVAVLAFRFLALGRPWTA